MKSWIWKIILIILAIGIAAIWFIYKQFIPAAQVSFGLTFSSQYARDLGFDPKQMYLDILSDLKPKKIRLMAYWEDIEPKQGQFDFGSVDYMLGEAQKRNIDVILVVGHKEPRWPECHQPGWVDNLTISGQNDAVIDFVKNSVGHFQRFSAIKIWQIENEPFFAFGPGCGKIPKLLVEQEILAARRIDSRPIMLTDSGEMGYWTTTLHGGADILGVTMYRTTHSPKLGYYQYPIPPAYYRIKAGFMDWRAGLHPIVGIELQAEPWLTNGVLNTDIATQLALMNPKILADNIAYAEKIGFADNYLWGVEWWYWLAKKQGDWGMWAAAKDLLAKQ